MDAEYGCKVCRVLAERDLDRYDDRLIAEWTGDGGARKGYRELARWLNATLLRREMDRVGLPTIGDEAESKYDRLRADGTRAAGVERVLAREGVDVDALRDDFVSYGVVRTHLLECLGAEYEPGESSDWETESIDIAREHASGKIADAVRSLLGKGRIESGPELSVHVSAELECETCQARVPLDRALRRGRVCRCEPNAQPTLVPDP